MSDPSPTQSSAEKPRRYGFYDFTARFLTLFFRLYCRASWHGREHVPDFGPLILASNHASFFDPPLIGCSLPREICYLARESLFKFRPFGKIISALNSIPVDRDGGGGKGLKLILNQLLSGQGILLFPEGTRTSDGHLLPAQPGIGLTILRSQAPVIPAYIHGSFEAFSRHHKFPKPHRISVFFGPEIDFGPLRDAFASAPQNEKKRYYLMAAEMCLEAIAKLKSEYGHP